VNKRSSADVGFLLIDGMNVLGETTKLKYNIEAITEETYGLGTDWTEHSFTGIKKLDLSQEGFYDTKEASTNEALCSKSGANRLICFGLDGNLPGLGFVGFEGVTQINFKRIASRGELHKANAEYGGAGQADEGIILHPHVTRIGDGDTEADAVDNGAATTGGGAAYLQVSELDLKDFTGATVTILHKTKTGQWEPLVTFTGLTAAPAMERIVITGAVKQVLAASWQFTGEGEALDPSIKFLVGFKRF
jgi:hypothetical protein